MKQKGSTLSSIIIVILFLIVIIGGYFLIMKMQGTKALPPGMTTATSTAPVAGMSEYTDTQYGFTFWYPSALSVVASSTQDSASFPGGVVEEILSVGPQGGTTVFVVDSPSAMITDEPNGHASPIAQTKYFYDGPSGQWMVAYPEGAMSGGPTATTTADTSKTTVAGLFELPSGKRFDTTIIPLSTTRFIVVSDGGGSFFTSELAHTVAPIGATIDPNTLNAAVAAEAAAYNQQQ